MQSRLVFTPTAERQLAGITHDPAKKSLLKQVRKTLGFLELNPRHPSLNTHEFSSLAGVNGEKVFEAYAQNNTPGAYRIFWHYGPDAKLKDTRVPVITIIAITPHP